MRSIDNFSGLITGFGSDGHGEASGLVVGKADNTTTGTQAAEWSNGTITALGGLPVSTDPNELRHAFEVNVIAPIALTAAVLPGMLDARLGPHCQRLQRRRRQSRQHGQGQCLCRD